MVIIVRCCNHCCWVLNNDIADVFVFFWEWDKHRVQRTSSSTFHMRTVWSVDPDARRPCEFHWIACTALPSLCPLIVRIFLLPENLFFNSESCAWLSCCFLLNVLISGGKNVGWLTRELYCSLAMISSPEQFRFWKPYWLLHLLEQYNKLHNIVWKITHNLSRQCKLRQQKRNTR